MHTFTPVQRFIGAALLLCCTFFSAVAQEKMKDNMMKATVQGAFVKQSMYVENQFVTLAEAVPQDKYNWRPAEGVRSIAESFIHVARGNYAIMSFIGGKVPEGVNLGTIETSTTDKAKIVAMIKQSFEAVNNHIKTIPESDFGKEVDFFGNKLTVLDMIMIAATHQHETLGQAIAYARTNGVAPPWSSM